MRWADHVPRKRQKRNAYWSLVGTVQSKRELKEFMFRWQDNIKSNLET